MRAWLEVHRVSEKKPTPLVSQPSGKVCPVCGSRTYSQGGIHPQCAVHQADAARTAKLKADRKRGWGLKIIKGLMDEVEIDSGPRGTTVVMSKSR